MDIDKRANSSCNEIHRLRRKEGVLGRIYIMMRVIQIHLLWRCLMIPCLMDLQKGFSKERCLKEGCQGTIAVIYNEDSGVGFEG